MQNGHVSGQQAEPCVMTIFGASGDLTKRKLIPALCNLAAAKLMPHDFALIGFASGDLTTESWRAQLTSEIGSFVSEPIDQKIWNWLMERTYYIKGAFENADDFQKLKNQIAECSKTHHAGDNKYFYMAVAPRFFAPVVQQLGAAGLTKQEGGHWTRVIVEKPFGRDLESAKKLNYDLKQ